MTPAPLTLARIRVLRTYLGQRQSHHMLTIDNGQAAEIDAALAAAEALARLEALLTTNDAHIQAKRGGYRVIFNRVDQHAPTLLAALTKAIDEEEAGT